jgi:hypothetical protein
MEKVSRIQHHIIRREIVDLVLVGTESDGLVLQRKLAELCGNWLAPALEESFTRTVAVDEHWSFDRLEVDAGSFTLETFERDFAGAVAAAVEKQIKVHSLRLDGPQRHTEHKLASRNSAATAASASHGNGSVDDERSTAFGRLTEAQSKRQAFLHFLTTGTLPWWFHLPAGLMLEQAVAMTLREHGTPDDFRTALNVLLVSSTAQLRLVRQFSAAFLDALIERMSLPAAKALQEVRREMARREMTQQTLQSMSERLWRAGFVMLASQQPVSLRSLIQEWMRLALGEERVTEQRAISELVQVWPETADLFLPTAKVLSTEQVASLPSQSLDPLASLDLNDSAGVGVLAEERSSSAGRIGSSLRSAALEPVTLLDIDGGLFVDCAGVVLLHPFLTALFERLHVAAEGELVQPDRALALLHFLATGETRAPEYTLVLPKLLCGLPLAEPVGAPVELTKDETAEADNLLTAVIGHWTALGDASPEALRGTFLTRPGKLSKRDDDFLLQVEPQSFDVLLDQLPWGVGAIRLPWMKTLLWVEWRM